MCRISFPVENFGRRLHFSEEKDATCAKASPWCGLSSCSPTSRHVFVPFVWSETCVERNSHRNMQPDASAQGPSTHSCGALSWGEHLGIPPLGGLDRIHGGHGGAGRYLEQGRHERSSWPYY